MEQSLTVRRYARLVAAGGALVLLGTLVASGYAAVASRPLLFVTLAAMVAVTEWFPVRVVGTGRSGYLTVSVPFVVTSLLLFGGGPTALVLVGASMGADLRRRQPLLPTLFNAGQYSLAIAAAAVVAGAAGASGQPDGPSALAWAVLVGVVFVGVNNLLTTGIVLIEADDTAVALRGLVVEAAMDGTLLLAAPVVLLVAGAAPQLLPVLLLPALAVHRGARHARRTEYEALHDSLTGLPNRTYFLRRLERQMQRARTLDRTVGVALIDLDDFREVNDTLGHETGDRLLREVAARLQEAVGEAATVARLGGDEFGLLLPDLPSPDTAATAAQTALGGLRRPFVIDGFPLEIDASIGLSLFPAHGADGGTLVRCADVAMYLAKDGRLGAQVYAPELDTFSRDRLRLLADLRGAIDGRQFVCWYQPQIDLTDGHVTGVEALVRWEHPERGLLSPAAFIPLAERTSHIDALTGLVLDQALAQHRRWQAEGLVVPVAVNVPPHTLHAPGFVAMVDDSLRRHGVAAHGLQIEITEGTIMRDQRRAVAALMELRALGVRVAIDDFGTGYASLSYLRDLPVDIVKIDRAFVSGVHREGGDRAIVRSTVELARALEKETVAEGVEDSTALPVLRAFGCSQAQGYLFSRPEPPERLTQWMRGYGVTRHGADGTSPPAWPAPGRGPVSAGVVE